MYTYEIYQHDTGYGYRIIKNNTEVMVEQPFNPETGQPFNTQKEAETYAQQIVNELNLEELTSNPPHLKVQFLNPATNEEITVANVNDAIKVNVELYYPIGVDPDTGEQQIMYAPVTGDYLVTYFYEGTDTPAGTTKIHIENGQGSGIIKIDESGVFEIKLDRILNAQTMQQPNPLPIPDSNPKIAIVKPLTSDVSTSTTTDTTSV